MRIVFFTGAGISEESGLQTFRDAGGLWEGHALEEVCTAAAWERNPARVLEFYNWRRKGVVDAVPNAAHLAISELEAGPHDVAIVTQNVDDLHERARSRKVLHLHGEIVKSRSDTDRETFYECSDDLKVGDLSPDGCQLRPHVVLFGEAIYNYDAARSLCKRADILVVVGTSLAVRPASYLARGSNARKIYAVDPGLTSRTLAAWDDRTVVPIRKPATEGVPEVIRAILQANKYIV